MYSYSPKSYRDAETNLILFSKLPRRIKNFGVLFCFLPNKILLRVLHEIEKCDLKVF